MPNHQYFYKLLKTAESSTVNVLHMINIYTALSALNYPSSKKKKEKQTWSYGSMIYSELLFNRRSEKAQHCNDEADEHSQRFDLLHSSLKSRKGAGSRAYKSESMLLDSRNTLQ